MKKTFNSKYDKVDITIKYDGRTKALKDIDLRIRDTTLQFNAFDVHSVDPFREIKSAIQKFDKWFAETNEYAELKKTIINIENKSDEY
jgi:hypothetical protein